MALVTLQRSPTPSAASSSASNSELEAGSDEDRKLNLSLSESFFMVKGAALFLQQGNSPQGQRSLQHPHRHAGDLPQHLQVMINLLRCEDRIKLAVRLESVWTDRVRYMVVVYTSGRQDTEENILLGVDFSSKESKSCTIGMVLRLWSDTKIHLDGDGGFSVSTAGRTHIFKPVSVQAMWSALQVLHKACEVARRHNYFPGGVALIWATYYESCIGSEQSCINEWNAMQDLESTRPDSPALFVDKPTEGERTERLIKAKLRSIMMSQDLENVTSKEIRNELEKQMNCSLKEFKEFIDNEMLLILGQMDKPSLIFDHLYLGSEWNASNLEELQGSGVDYILNVTREIDNFFPGLFAYHNIRVYDEETTDLLAHWNEAYHFINKAKRNRSKCLVHCKMGVSRSASTVIAYAMKEFGWPLERAYNYVKQRRSITRPNAGFMRQLSEYEGILDASKQRHNKLWRQQPADDVAAEPGEFSPETLDGALDTRLPCLDESTQPGLPGSQDPGGPSLPCCFRRLSDPLLLPHHDDMSGLVHLEDLERDALLEDVAQPEGVHRLLQQPLEGARLCEKDVKRKLEFGSPKARGGSLPPMEEMEKDGGPRAGRWRRASTQLDRSLLDQENLNNNNSKRSCPDDLERDAVFGILSKVKPSYTSCADCMYPTAGGAPEAFTEQHEDPRAPAVCTQPAFLPHVTSSAMAHTSSRPRAPERPPSGPANTPPFLLPAGSKKPDISGSGARAAPEPPASLVEPSRETSKVLPKTLPLKNSHCDKSAANMEVAKEEVPAKKDLKPAKDLRLLFSHEAEKPTANSYLMQHQESIIQLQKAGLVRKHTKELERLKSLPPDSPSTCRDSATSRLEASIPEEGPEPGHAALCSQAGTEEKPPDGALLKSPSATLLRLDHTSNFSKDFLKTVCYTPTSSSMSSNLTRSSSSDSIHSIRGKPGLVKQRAQEIETRLRLAGLTVSSPLKRSHSLAKLGSLNFSTEDLSSEADTSTIADSQDAKCGHSSFLPEPQAALRDPPATSKPSGQPTPEPLKSPLRMTRS
ncbi:protein phosphatase Slingshot homolog 1 isoform X1 [Meriones unguiculatus]|uniref:protein phosphatase Slingshot homolog 1 isoform X1 n=2 Tax=Meriones unguiculatus TaxID=10047 RepID=UPI000B4F7319|nr:protein phosphatase Slingshot homolog 1 isoform X1 [Meriones unguiculatus]XP_021501731.1 protein phosphatase Slingshot homolog 1 [Meriones unguiculatus]